MKWGLDVGEARRSMWRLGACPGCTSPQPRSPALTANAQNTLMATPLRGGMKPFHAQPKSFLALLPWLCLHRQPPVWVAASCAICIFLPHTVDITYPSSAGCQVRGPLKWKINEAPPNTFSTGAIAVMSGPGQDLCRNPPRIPVCCGKVAL